ncbi:MAG: hypothetical protein ACFE0O_06070 [Opitutales bacterium]
MAERPIRYFKAFILYFLIAMAGTFFLAVLVGFLVSFYQILAGKNPNDGAVWQQVTGAVIGLVVSFFVYRWSIERFILPQHRQQIEGETAPSAGEGLPGGEATQPGPPGTMAR